MVIHWLAKTNFSSNEIGGLRTFSVTASTIIFPYLANILMKYFPCKYLLSKDCHRPPRPSDAWFCVLVCIIDVLWTNLGFGPHTSGILAINPQRLLIINKKNCWMLTLDWVWAKNNSILNFKLHFNLVSGLQSPCSRHPPAPVSGCSHSQSWQKRIFL